LKASSERFKRSQAFYEENPPNQGILSLDGGMTGGRRIPRGYKIGQVSMWRTEWKSRSEGWREGKGIASKQNGIHEFVDSLILFSRELEAEARLLF